MGELKVNRKYTLRKFKKGVSDLVVILTLVAIAIPIALAVQGWLGAQASRMNSYVATPEIQGILVSKSVSSTGQLFVIKVKNSGNGEYNLSTAAVIGKAVLEDGSIVDATIRIASSATTLKPGESATLSVLIPGTTNVVRTINIEFQEINTGNTASITVSAS